MDPHASVRLEKQVAAQGSRVHLDLLVQGSDYEVAVEVKYKTRAAKIVHSDETYTLRNQSAQDIGRHDFLKDIERLEKYVASHPGSIGYAILLTNDRSYWSQSKKIDPVDSAFRVHEGRNIEGSVTWGAGASEGTKHNRKAVITLEGKYKMAWHEFSSLGSVHAEKFRYVALQIPSDS